MEYQLIMQSLDTNKKFLIVTPWYGFFAGGAEKLARGLAVQLDKRGFEVKVFSTRVKSPYDDWWQNTKSVKNREIIDGIKVTRFSVGGANKNKYQDSLKSILRGNKDDSIGYDFFNNGISSSRLVSEVGSYLNDGWEVIVLPYFQTLTHHVINQYPGKIVLIPCLHNERELVLDPVTTLLQNSKKIIFNTPEEKLLAIRTFASRLGHKILDAPIAGVGIDTQIIPADPIKQNSNIKIPKQFALYLGRKEKGKNVDLLVKWHANYINTVKKPLPLVFVGEGDNKLIPHHKYFIDFGYVPDETKQQLINSANVVVNLSVNESFSYVLMEAWLNHKPVVILKECEVTNGHLLRSGGGFAIENQNDYIASLNLIKTRKTLTTKLGEQGFDYVLANYSWDVVIPKLINELT